MNSNSLHELQRLVHLRSFVVYVAQCHSQYTQCICANSCYIYVVSCYTDGCCCICGKNSEHGSNNAKKIYLRKLVENLPDCCKLPLFVCLHVQRLLREKISEQFVMLCHNRNHTIGIVSCREQDQQANERSVKAAEVIIFYSLQGKNIEKRCKFYKIINIMMNE